MGTRRPEGLGRMGPPRQGWACDEQASQGLGTAPAGLLP